MKKVYEASTPGFSRVMSNVAQFFSGRTMSALPRLATLLCLSIIGHNVAYAQPCAGVSCSIGYAPVPVVPPAPPLPAGEIILCLNAEGEAEITAALMGPYTTTSSGCCDVVRVWQNSAATDPMVPADADYLVDCTDIGRTIQVWVTREVNLPPTGYGRSAALPFTILIADCTPPNITCPAPETLTCLAGYLGSFPPNPMSYDDFNNLGGGALVTDNAQACVPTGYEVSYSDVISNFICTNRFTVTRTYVAVDASGNTKSCTQVITVSDNVAPTFTTLPTDLTLNCPDITSLTYAAQVVAIQLAIQNWLNNAGGAAVDDNCGGPISNNIVACLLFDPILGCLNASPVFGTTVWDQFPDECSPGPREVQVTFFVKDECDNQAFASAKVILVDNVNPSPSLAGFIQSVLPGNGGNFLPTLPGLPTLFPPNLNVYTCADLVPGPNIESIRPYVDDNCSPVQDLLIEWVSDNPTTVDGCAPGALGVDIIERVYRVTDCAGNSETFVQNIRVKDNVAPDWTNNPNPLVLDCDADLTTAIAAWLASKGEDGAVTDNCNNATVTTSPADAAAVIAAIPAWCPGNTPFRQTTVTFTATDDCGNTSTRTAMVRLRDFDPPTGTAPANITVQCVADVPVPNPAAITDEADDCSTPVAVAHLATTPILNGNGCDGDEIIYRRNYSLTDCAGNSRVVTQMITVRDTIDPIWAGTPIDLTLNCTQGLVGQNAAINIWLNARGGTSASDNCATVTYTTNPVNVDNIRDALGACAPLAGTTVVTFIATDACGNSSTVTGTLTITDNTPPTASTPIASNYNCLSEVPAPNVNVVTNEADVCSPAGSVTVAFISQSDNGGAGCPGNTLVISRIYRVMDCSFVDVATTPNNYIDVVHTITVNDNVEPNANCQPATAYLGADGTVEVNASSFNDGSSDNCVGTLTYEFARDEALDDLELIYGPYTTTKEFNCDDIVPNLESCNGNVNNSEVIGVRLKVFDACSNESGFCTTALTLVDDIKPTIACPADRTINTSDDGGYDCQTGIEIEHPTPEDNCDVVCYEMEVQKEINGVFVTINPEFGNPEPNFRVDVLGVSSSNYIFNKGPYCNADQIDDEYKIIYYVRDEHGNSLAAPCDYLIKVMDDEAPVFTYCPSDPIIEALTVQNDCYQFKCWAPPTFYDNCQYPFFGEGSGECPIPTMTVSAVSTFGPNVNETVMVDTIGDDHCALFPVGVTEVTYTVTDICGNSTTCVVTVIITDEEAPMAMCVAPFTVNMEPDGLMELTFAQIDAGSTDNCGICSKEIARNGAIWATCPDSVGLPTAPCFGGKIYLECGDVNTQVEVYLRVKDCSQPLANEHICTTYVTVQDMQTPGIATCPADIVVCTDANACNAEVGYLRPTFNDGCGSEHLGILTIGLDSGLVFPIGNTLVRWDYASASGYNVACQFNVTVEDCEAPAMVCPPAVTLTCLEALCCPEDFTGGTLTDNCGVTLLQSSDFDNGLSHCTYDGIRTIIRTYTAWDAAGNTSTCSRTYVYTEDTEVPVLAETPADATYECASEVPAPPVQSATDNCGTVNIDFSEVVNNEVCVNQQVIVRTWIATDLCGNQTNWVQTITVNDEDAPTFSNEPANFSSDCSEDVPVVAAPDVADNCDVFTVEFSEAVAPGGCEDQFVVTRTWVATDICGNASTYVQTITINDDVDPVFAGVEADYDVQCAEGVLPVVQPTVSDNCVQVTVDFSETVTPGGCEDNFTVVRRWVATDACGNSAVAVQIIGVNDNTKPVLANLPDERVVVECAQDVPAVAAVTASDNCSEPLTIDFVEVEVPGDCDNQYQIIRTWTAEDDCGNNTSFVQTIVVFDGTAPTFSNEPADYASDCSEDVPAVVAPDVADNCDVFTVDFSETVAPGGCEDQFVVTRTWVATDMCGNANTYVQTITINDDVAPVFSNVPAGYDVSCAEGVLAVVAPDVADNCSQVVVDFSETVLSNGCEDKFTVTRTWVATDLCGNQAMTVQIINVSDVTAPVLAGLPDATVSVSCAQAVPAVANVTATDNCGEPIQVIFNEVEIPGTCHDQYQVRRTWTAEDDCGNSTSFVQLITVNDDVAPVLFNLPAATVNVECSEEVPDMPSPAVYATDNCGAPIVLQFSEVEIPGTCANQYSITRTWSAQDNCGNATWFVQTINVSDTEAPVLFNLPTATVNVECSEAVPDMPNPAVFATDNCASPIVLQFSEVEIPGTCSNQYSITRTWTAQDDCGNATSFVQTINISDTEAPVLFNLPVATVNVECSQDVPDMPNPAVYATDNCASPIVLQFSEVEIPGTCSNQYSITRTWTAQDDCGNATSFVQTINISDTEAPVLFNLPAATVEVECASDVPAMPDPAVYATDNCGNPVDLQFSEVEIPGLCVNQYVITRTWTAQDDCGNSTSFVQTITIHDDEAPELYAKPIRRHYQCIEQVEDAPYQFATDNCDVTTIDFYETENPGNCPSSVIIVRRWVAYDLCGNSSEWEQEIHVLDTIAPIFLVTPVDRTYECLDDVANAPDQGTMATDNCGPVFVDFMETRDNDSCQNQVIIIRRWEATDLCGNKNTHWQYITVYDDKAPVFATTPTDRTYDCVEKVETAPIQVATDNCLIVNVDFAEFTNPGACPNQVVINRRWIATDLCGNTTEHWQVITVNDTQAPVFNSTPLDLVLDCSSDVPAAPIVTATDNCEIVFVDFSESTAPGGCQNQYVVTRKWVATDLCGNFVEHYQTITVNDDEAPVLSSMPINLAVDCTEDVPAAPIVTATDNCDVVFVDFSESTEPGSCLNQYIVTRHWEATDLCGNKTEHYQTITVNDNVAPTWTSTPPADVTVQCGEDVLPATLAATDNCGAPLVNEFNETLLPGAGPNDAATLTRTWTVTDACGNSIQHTQVVTINDTQDPVLGDLPAATVNVVCAEDVPAVAAVTYTDNCQGSVDFDFNETILQGDCDHRFTLIRTWTATDFAGNSTQFVQTINVNDNVLPTWTSALPANVTVQCGEEVLPETVTASDNCAGAVQIEFNETLLPGAGPNDGATLTRVWTASDVCGNSIQHTQVVTINDTQDPVLGDLPAATVNVVCAEDVPAIAAVTYTDNCQGTVDFDFNETILPGDCAHRFTLVRTWTATDFAGNSTQFVQTINVNDNVAPTWTSALPANVTVQCGEEVQPATVTASDNCAGAVQIEFNETLLPGAGPNDGATLTRVWTASDVCGNSIQHTQVITINDTQDPVLANLPPAVVNVVCAEDVPAIAAVTYTDNCQGTVDFDFNETILPGDCAHRFTLVRTWTATDFAGNSTQFVQTINVNDNVLPTWTSALPANVTVQCGEEVQPATVTASDNCAGQVVIEMNETLLPGAGPNDAAVLTRTWIAYDVCGNSIQHVQTITVNDTQDPVLANLPPAVVNVVCAEDVPAIAAVTYTDNCQGTVDFDFNETILPGDCAHRFTLVRTWTATDFAGNSTQFVQTINVNDNVAPTWTSALPANVTVQCGEEVQPATVTASDNCAGQVVIEMNETLLPGAGPNDAAVLTRTWIAYDVCGNSIQHVQTITINDTQSPVLANLPPATVSVECSEEVPAVAAVTYTDNCQGTVNFDFSEVEVPGTCPNQYQIVRTWTATDFAGNSTQFVQTITISDTKAPVWNTASPVVWINEIHYDNVGTDVNEFIELAGTTGVDLSGYSLVLYNGANGLLYGTMGLSGVIGNQSNGFGTASFGYPVNGVQNGSPDGMALVHNGIVLQFLSYEGSFLAVDGPAAGMMSTNIGVQEDGSNPIGTSLSLIGTGNSYADFAWSGPSTSSAGALNIGQTMTAPAGFSLPADVTVQCGENVPMPMVLTATDNCNAPVDVEYSEVFVPAAGPNDGMSIIRTWTAEDDCGNSIVHTQTVTINDTQAPVLANLPAATVNVVCAEDVPAIAAVTYTDNCQGTVNLDFSESILPGDCAHRFTLTRTWTATDFAGNSTQFVQTITVNDNVAPTWTSALPANVTVQCGEEVLPATVTASDNCAGQVVIEMNETLLPGAGPNDAAVLTRTWIAYDVCGNSIQHVQTVTINDTQAPVLANLPAATVNVVCAENVPAIAPVTYSDNCQGTVNFDFNETILPGDCAHRFTLVRTWTATDFAGNSTQFVQTINVNDNVAPTWTSALPANVTVQCGEDVLPATLTASDNCAGQVVIEMNETLLPGAGPNDAAVLTRTWIAYDVCGNSIQHVQIITISDTQAPVLGNLPAATVNVTCSSDVPAIAGVTYSDNCQGTVDFDFNETILPGDCVQRYTLVRTWTATDFAGNSTQFVQTINVNDNVAPTWTSALPANVTVQCGEEVLPATLTATDNCGGTVVIDFSETLLPGAGPNDGATLTRTWTAYDLCGNSIQHVQVVSILDTQAPVLGNLPVATVNIECSSLIPAVAAVTVTDNCQGTVDMDYSESILLGNCINQYTLTRTWLATDFAGNTAVFVQTINVNDTQAPVWDNPAPVNETVSCASDVPAAPAQTATDNCGVPVITDFSEIVQPGNCLNRFTLVRTWSVQDDCGNATSRQQIITVSDDTAPVMSCPAPLQAQCSPAEQPPYANLTEFTSAGGSASDNCGLNVNSFGLLSETAVGNVYTRTYRVVDQCGNAGTCQQTVTVLDTQAPVFLNCPVGPLVFGNDPDQCSAKINWPAPVAVDNCSIPTVVQTAGPTAGSVVPVGTYTVTFLATDAMGNTAICSFQVMVMDTEKPEFDADILMPADVTVECDAVPAPFVLTNNDVNDNCTPSNLLVITFTEVRTNGNCAFNYTLTRTWRVTDQAGNQLVHTQIVTVRDTKAPTAICQNATVTLDKAGNASITAAQINNGSFDNCSAQANLTLSVSPSTFTCANLGANTVTLTVTDQCGNSATCTAIVTVLEGIGPCVPQITVSTTCKNNATTMDNGQFEDLITVKSLAMQTWTVVSSTGLYLTNSPAPPAAPTPLPVGTTFTAGLGNDMVNYRLSVVHIEAIGYTVTIQNNLGQTATISNKGFYPTPYFLNLDGPFCLNTDPFVIQVGEQYNAQGTVTNIMVNGVNTNTFNAAQLGIGFHTVMATFDAGGATTNLVINGQLVGGTIDQALADPGCQQKITKIVQVVSTPTTIVCNDMVNVSISNDGGNCVFVITPDNVLEGSYLCDDDYSVVITYPAGTNTYNPANRVDNTHIGKLLNYTLVHSQSGNVCWGKIKVEDKEAPVLTCPTNITIACSDPTAPSFTGQLLISDCSSTTSVVTDDFTDFGSCSDPRAEIVRLWLVTDASGNQSSCTQRITIAAFNLAAVIFPADVTLNCATVNSTDPSVTGSPSINGSPIGTGGLCMASISKTDDRYEICPGSYEIVRTWKVRNMCLPISSTNPREHQQVIKVIDTEGPTFDCPVDVTVSTDPFNCCATAPLPSVIITEGCSYVTSLEYRVIGTDFATGNLVIHEGTGFLGDFPGNNYWVPDTLGSFGFTQCLPRGEYDVTYTAIDACGNISKCTFKLFVEDLIPPVAVCDEFTQVALGADGMAFVNAYTFDDGSYDVCESVHFKARRMDTNDCQSNEFFLDQVKFCCSDINDTILIVFRVYDIPVPNGSIGQDEYEGHYNDCMVQVYVEDKIKPLCNAPAQITVTCESFDPTLWAYGFATGLDNCCMDTITETRNISLFDTVCNRGTITRTFRAFDCGGNSASCTQRVIVTYEQDYFVRFPNDVIVTVCDGTGNYGEPTFFGEDCELLGVSHKDDTLTVVPDACYMIERTWSIINWCTYNPNAGCINVPNPNPNPNSQSPANLPGPIVSAAGTPAPWAPTVIAILPGQTPTNYSTFWSANANCYTYKQTIKIIDTQKPIIDNCPVSPLDVCDITPNSADLWNAMYWWDNTTGSHDLCEAPTDLTINATDLCSGADVNIRYLLFLDLNGDGDMETVINSTTLPGFNNVNVGNALNPNFSGGTPSQFDFRPVPANQKYGFALQTTTSGATKTASVRWNTQQQLTTYTIPELPYGTHKIKWIVDDGCGNEQVCEYTFIVKDCKKPTVVCLNGLSVNIMPTKMVSLWDTDFLQYTEDNCTPSTKLVTAIRKAGQGTGFPRNPDNTPQKLVTFDCNELGKQNVELWSIDLAGNADYCLTFVDVQDNSNNCSTTSGTVAGALKTESGNGLEDANVELDGSSPSNPSVNMLVPTDVDGKFLFGGVPFAGDYTVTPIKDNDPLNGVSTFDLVLINKHILGIEPLNTPFKMIAADANNSRSITTFDIVELRKLILGIYTELPNNTSWRFVDADFNFPNQLNPFQTIFPETKQIANMQSSMLTEDFTSVKVGDVNGNAVTSSLVNSSDRTEGTLLFDLQDRTVKAGETFTVNFRAAERAIGYQFTLHFPNMEVVDVVPGASEMSMINFGIFNSEHSLTTSFDNDRANGEFAVTFRAKAAGTLSQMLAVSSQITKAEAYSLNRERQSIALRFNGENGSTVAGLGFELYQNQPNPWMNKTQVGFYLPEAAEATLTIFDETGRTLFVQKGAFSKGYNAFGIERALVNTTGVLYYKLETATDSAVKKMIQTK